MRVIKADRTPATVEAIAALQFAAVKQFRGSTQEERIRKAHALADRIRPTLVIACELVGLERAELIDRVEKNYEVLGPALMALAHAREDAKAILEILASAEVRLATALANVEAEEDPRTRDQRF
jgi:hypothetical protein